MKRGFTLVELLAVIVILAVIALITIPAVMKMIDSSTTNSYRRSVDLYGKAVSQGIISYESDMVEKGQKIDVSFETIQDYIEYEGNDVDCRNKVIYSDKTILLTECYVDEELVHAEEGKGYSNENYYYYTNSKKKMKLIEYIKAVEEAIAEKSINGTCNIAEDKITCNGQDITIRSKLENAIEGSLTIENNKVKSYNNLKFETEKKVIKQEEMPEVVDEQITNNENETVASESINYRGYYADVDGDGTPDGVIYADLAHSKSGQLGDLNGVYSYISKTNLKEYIVSKDTYKKNDGFGTKPIISLKSGSIGNSRFYVMALEDFKTGSFETGNTACGGRECEVNTYYWYNKAIGRMPNPVKDTKVEFGTGYANTGKIIEIWNKNGVGEGSYLGATQDDHDIFKHIQQKYQKGWYIPSRGEWAAFEDYFSSKEENRLTNDSYMENSGNYNISYELSNRYWLSSQYDDIYNVYYIHFGGDGIKAYLVNNEAYIRLSITF